MGSYLLSVTVGVAFLVSVLLLGWSGASGVVFTVMMFAMAWLTGVIVAAVPCALLALIARLFAIRNLAFYLIVGVGVGLLLTPVFFAISNSSSWYTDPPDERHVTMLQGIKLLGMNFAAAGGLAGLTF